MIALFLLLLLSTSPDATTTVEPNEKTLSQVAARSLGDSKAAPELRALNHLTSDTVAPGTTLKLPGPDRALANSALAAARNAVAAGGKNQNADASKHLREAEKLFREARYRESAQAADSTWRLLSESATQPTRFAVEVAEDGKTKVASRTGQPVRVEAQGVTQPVYAGQSVRVEKGKPPSAPESAPLPPLLVSPHDNFHLYLRGASTALGPVILTWHAVNGAQSYEVEVTGSGAPLALKSARPEARLPPLAAGRYSWTVRAIKGEVRSAPSATRSFELSPDAMKLDVKGKGFQ
ncbi:MAG: peptidoglycan-binding protein LysM [Myxococcaceae bacterium]